MISIRRRLIVVIALVLSLLWLAATAWSVYDMRQEVRRVLDARLASSARMVQTLVERGELPVRQAQRDLQRLSEALAQGEREEAGLTCQLWSLDGELMSLSRGAPVVAAPRAVPDGYSNQLIDGERWRVFALTAPDSGLRILTAERRDLRRALLEQVALSVSAPFLLTLPAMVLLVWWGVGRGLQPLRRVRAALQQRHADALDALPTTGVPVESGPLVEALNRLFQRLQRSFDRERRFTGDAAHELRTPIAGLKTQLQLARSAEGEQQARALGRAEELTDRMGQLVQQLLDLARLEAAAVPVAAGECHPLAVLRSVAAELGPEAEGRGVALAVHGEPELRAAVAGPILRVAVSNLVSNALAYAPAGTCVDLELRELPSGLELEVRDRGPGIPEDQLPQVTERFYRVADGGGGSGLGLAIVAAVAQRHGGELELRNRCGGSGLRALLRFHQRRSRRVPNAGGKDAS